MNQPKQSTLLTAAQTTQIALLLAEQLAGFLGTVNAAQAEGRQVTMEEVDESVKLDDEKRAELVAEIERARAAEIPQPARHARSLQGFDDA